MLVTTSICANYLPKAMILAKSLKKHNPNVKFMLCLLENEVHETAKNFKYFDYIVLSKNLGFDNFNKFIFKHSIVEASTSVKGQIFRYMINNFKEEDKFVYLDPDIKVYGPLIELDNLLNNNEIVITPHLVHAEDCIDAVMDNELCALQHGVFNLGFLAIKRGEQSKKFIDWWANRLEMFCYDDIPRGIFTDQKWIDLAPCFFDVAILKHPGYNIAPWNLSNRKVKKDNDGKYLVNDEQLRFFHYSGFDSGANEAMINKYVPDKNNIIYKLRDEYVKEMEEVGQEQIGKTPWFYDYYNSGQKIDRLSRLIYRDNPIIKYKVEDPFSESNEVFLNYIESKNDESSICENNPALINRINELEKEMYSMKNTLGWRMLESIRRKFPISKKIFKKIIDR